MIPLINVSVFVPIPSRFCYFNSVVHLKIRVSDPSLRSFIVQNCFSYLELFVFPYEIEYFLFKVCRELGWNFDGDCAEFVDYFW